MSQGLGGVITGHILEPQTQMKTQLSYQEYHVSIKWDNSIIDSWQKVRSIGSVFEFGDLFKFCRFYTHLV